MELPETLAEVRAGIDALDTQLIQTLAARQSLVEQAGRLKRGAPESAVRAPARVSEVIADRRRRATVAGLDADVAEAV